VFKHLAEIYASSHLTMHRGNLCDGDHFKGERGKECSWNYQENVQALTSCCRTWENPVVILNYVFDEIVFVSLANYSGRIRKLRYSYMQYSLTVTLVQIRK
jgi:hypothetical protein